MNIDDFFLWLDENLPKEYKNNELAMAYDKLSKADVFKGRIRKRQYWRFLVYINALLTDGISASKKTSRNNFASYSKPSRFLKMFIAKQKYANKYSIAEKIAKETHSSMKKTMREMNFLKIALKDKEDELSDEIKLEPKEINWLKN